MKVQAQRKPWRVALWALFIQWVVWMIASLVGLGLLMMGWDLFLSGVFGIATLTPTEALGCWILAALVLVPILAGVELLRSR